jgi:Flp pilus assembly protein TadD
MTSTGRRTSTIDQMPPVRLIILMSLVCSDASAQSFHRAEIMASSCLFEPALKMLNDLPKTQQTLRGVQVFRARLLVQLERGPEAIAAAEAIAPSKNRRDEAERLLVLAFALSAGNQIAASELRFIEAEKMGADKPVVRGAIGALRLQEGKLEEAEKELRKALSLDATLSGALYNLALVRGRRGETAEAAALVRQAWHLGYRDPTQIRAEPDLEAVRKTPGLIDDLFLGAVPRCATF